MAVLDASRHAVQRLPSWLAARRRRHLGTRRAAGILGLLVCLSACAGRPTTRLAAVPASAALKSPASVVWLPPLVRFENMQTETIVSDDPPAGLGDRLRQGAGDVLRHSGVSIVDCATPDGAEWSALCRDLAGHALLLAKGIVRPEARALLNRADALQPSAVVLSESLLAKVGPGAFYDPNSGQIRAASTSSILNAALVDCATGEVVWKNDVLLRGLPEVGDERYHEAVQLLFEGAAATRE